MVEDILVALLVRMIVKAINELARLTLLPAVTRLIQQLKNWK